MRRPVRRATLAAAALLPLVLAAPALGAQARPIPRAPARAATMAPARPFGTLRAQAERQQRWLAMRLDSVLPALMRKHGVDMWVVPMREYNEDPVFSSLVSPTTFAARRRTIYVFFDQCAAAARPGCTVERLALGGSSQGALYRAIRSQVAVAGSGAVRGNTAELLGDAQWEVLKGVVAERNPRAIAIDVSRTRAFADGLSAGEYEGMREALGEPWVSRFRRAELLAQDVIATRLPDEEAAWRAMQQLAWDIIAEGFSNRVITPGTTRTSDVVWWMRQRVNDLGLGTWFQPSVDVQRRGATEAQLGDDPVIQRGDVLHCDFGITAMRLNTDTQHMGYVLRAGETTVPAGLRAALGASNRLQDIVTSELRPGRTGNEVLAASLARMRAAGIDGTVYSHPIGMHGHGAGSIIGLWDYQEGVPGWGDPPIIADMWYSIELQATSPVPEWDGQRVRSAQEEDAVVGRDGAVRWALRRQTEFHLVR
jgi:Xaa-Pro aminopeptidase